MTSSEYAAVSELTNHEASEIVDPVVTIWHGSETMNGKAHKVTPLVFPLGSACAASQLDRTEGGSKMAPPRVRVTMDSSACRRERAETHSAPRPLLALLVASLLVTGCAGPEPKTARDKRDDFLAPPDASPDTPRTKPRQRKKRDRQHHDALLDMLQGSWGARTDKDRQALFPLVHTEQWTRVRFTMVQHFTGFRYGKDHHSLTVAFVVPLDANAPKTSAACIERFEADSRAKVADVGGQVTEVASTMRIWRKQPLVVRTGRGEVDVFFRHHEAALAWAGYPAYPDACMVYAVVVPIGDSQDEALALRDRWVDAFGRFIPLTKTAPHRH